MENLALFIAALSMILLVPGPDMILLLQTGARHGRGKALATALGLAIARGGHVALAGLGLATLFKVSPWTFEIVRIVGAAYLLWLGLKMFKPGSMSTTAQGLAPDASISWRTAILRGLLTNLLNPKVFIFLIAFLPQFTDPAQGPVWLQMLALAVFSKCMGLATGAGFAYGASRIRGWLTRNPWFLRAQEGVLGATMIAIAGYLVFSRGEPAR